MKTLNEYLNTNVKIDNFKKFTTKEDVCEFLENKGFEFFETTDLKSIINGFSEAKKPVYCIGEFDYNDAYSWWVRFGNGGKNNLVFFWRIIENQQNYIVTDYFDHVIKEFKKFEEFKEYVKNYFGW